MELALPHDDGYGMQEIPAAQHQHSPDSQESPNGMEPEGRDVPMCEDPLALCTYQLLDFKSNQMELDSKLMVY